MRLSKKTLDFLVGLITGDSGLSPARTEPQLADFFDNRAEWEPFGYGFPPRDVYVHDRLDVYNGSGRMKQFVERAFVSEEDGDIWPDNAALAISALLALDGYQLRKTRRPGVVYLGHKYPDRNIYEIEPLDAKGG